jgi:hypothetical protein
MPNDDFLRNGEPANRRRGEFFARKARFGVRRLDAAFHSNASTLQRFSDLRRRSHEHHLSRSDPGSAGKTVAGR